MFLGTTVGKCQVWRDRSGREEDRLGIGQEVETKTVKSYKIFTLVRHSVESATGTVNCTTGTVGRPTTQVIK